MDFYFGLPLYGQFPTKSGLFTYNYTTCNFFTIIAYHLNAHILLFRYAICNYIWHMGSQNYELISLSFVHRILNKDTQC